MSADELQFVRSELRLRLVMVEKGADFDVVEYDRDSGALFEIRTRGGARVFAGLSN